MEEHIGETVERMLERNQRVEADKAWETSWTRRSVIALITYACAAAVLIVIEVPNPLLSALVPVVGYLLSVQSLPFIKKQWLMRVYRK